MDYFDFSRTDAVGDAMLAASVFVLCFVADRAMGVAGWFPTDPNGRYLSLHILVNTYVTIVHFDDLVLTYVDLEAAYRGPCDSKGLAAILALHLYHIVFFQPLPTVDWVHHIIMILLMLPMAWALQPGTLLGHGAWFSSGFPGGVDYVMLVMVKKGWLNPLEEKRINRQIMVWIRCPGCLFHSLFAWVIWVDMEKRSAAGDTEVLPLSPLPQLSIGTKTCLSVVIITFFWNGLYFMERVVANHAVKSSTPASKKAQ